MCTSESRQFHCISRKSRSPFVTRNGVGLSEVCYIQSALARSGSKQSWEGLEATQIVSPCCNKMTLMPEKERESEKRTLCSVQPTPVISLSCPSADPVALQSQNHGLVVSLAGLSRNKGRSMRHLLPEHPCLLLLQRLERAPPPRPAPTHLFLHASDLRQPTYSVIGPPAQLPPTTVGALFPVDAKPRRHRHTHLPQAAN